jgi:NAD(P)H dehydrogenase (quinone)
VYHSNTGHTAKLSEAVEQGAASVEAVDAHRLAIVGDDIVKGRWDNPAIMARLDASDAIIFGAPTSMGDVSGPMKCFLDSTSKHFYPRVWADKLTAGFTSSFYPSGDKLHTLTTFVTFAMQHGMLWIGHNAPGSKRSLPSATGPQTSTGWEGGWVSWRRRIRGNRPTSLPGTRIFPRGARSAGG